MELDNLLTFPRWRILEIVSQKPASPLEISNRLGTSLAYVSQQLKLLEAAKLVKKDRTKNVEKGKPRFLFSISKDIMHMTILSNNFSKKKIVNLDERGKTLLRIWLIEEPRLRYAIERMYWAIEKDLPHISGIFLDTTEKKPILRVVSDSNKFNPKSLLSDDNSENLFKIVVSKSLHEKIDYDNLTHIYTPVMFNCEENLKGGLA